MLRLDARYDTSAIESVAGNHRLPLKVVDVSGQSAEVYDRKLALVRIDQHVIWRGDELAGGIEGLFQVARRQLKLPSGNEPREDRALHVIACSVGGRGREVIG